MTDDPTNPDHVYWTKEVQRRSYAMEAARRGGASEDELARMQAEVNEAERQRLSASPASSPST